MVIYYNLELMMISDPLPIILFSRTMDWLMRHLYRMSLESERTGMTSKNLAIVWSPNILRCDVSELDTQDALQVQHILLSL